MIKIKIPDSEYQFTFSRSSGAGGQNINKVNSKATLTWPMDQSLAISDAIKLRFKAKFTRFVTNEGIVVITSQEHRNQKDNIDECLKKLYSMLKEAQIVPKVRHKTKPKRSGVEKRLKSKKRHSEKKKSRNQSH